MSDGQESNAGGGGEADATQPRLRLSRPHSLIRRTLDNKEIKDKWGYVQRPTWPGVDVRVSKTARRDALIILDRLFKALERHDIEASVIDGGYYDRDRGTFAVRGHDKVPIYVTEETKKIPHVATEKEIQHKAEHPYSARIPKYDNQPTGRLTLVPGGVADLSSEESLSRLIAIAVEAIIAQLDEAKAARERANAERERESRRQREAEEEKARAQAFFKAGESLRRYRELMDFIEEVRRSGRIPSDQLREGQTLDDWLAWAEAQARRVHPIG